MDLYLKVIEVGEGKEHQNVHINNIHKHRDALLLFLSIPLLARVCAHFTVIINGYTPVSMQAHGQDAHHYCKFRHKYV